MATADKLTYLSQTKSDIRDAIIAKGVSVPAATTFRDYVTKVGEISTGDPLKSKAYDYAERVSIDGGNVENVTAVKNLDTANTLLSFIPSGKKAGKAYSTTPIDGTGDFTVDRNSTSTYVAKDGLIKTALANEPRFDFSDGSAALLVEPQATNLVTYSEDFSNASWVKEFTTIQSNTEISPNGSLSASYVIANVGTNIVPRINYQFSSQSGVTYMFSIFVKKLNINWIRILSTGAPSSTTQSYYDILNGSVGVSGDPSFASLEDYGFGWYKLGFKVVAANTSSSATVRVQMSGGDGSSIITTNGTEKIICWGAQLETGSVPTSYIPTAGSTVTRLKDTITVNPPTGTTSITETIDNIEQAPITTIPPTYTVPNGNINKITMI